MKNQIAFEKLLGQKKLATPELLKEIEENGFAEIEDNDGLLSLIKTNKSTDHRFAPDTVSVSKQEDTQIKKTTVVQLEERNDVQENITPVTTQLQASTLISTHTPTSSVLTDSSLNTHPSFTTSPLPTSTPSLSDPASSVSVVFSYEKKPKKWEVKDFVHHYHFRYEFLSKILKNHHQLVDLISIGNLRSADNRTVSIIGLVLSKHTSKNGHLMLEIEDPTGTIRVVVSKTNKEIFGQAGDLVVDEVVGISGFSKKDVIFANSIVLPDIPSTKQKKYASLPGTAVFLSDIHVGSKQFLYQEFDNFLSWINGNWGTEEQKALAQQVKYVLVSGDVVDGVGIYPSQDKELTIKDIYEQYEELKTLLSKIPSHIKIILAPGNHDAMRLSEPQPALSFSSYAQPLKTLSNVVFVSNPGIVNIHASEDFEGFNILLYHGYSFDYYVAQVPGIRKEGGYDNPCAIMRFLLSRRHLAPSHGSTLYLPEAEDDALLIKQIPDIFLAGHVHRTDSGYYKNVLMINASCWQGMTSFQERMGHNPSPAKAQLFDLQTRKLHLLDFSEQISTVTEEKSNE